VIDPLCYSIAYGRAEEHAAALKRGLAQMVPGFTATLCRGCGGAGTPLNGGFGRACEECGGMGLCQGIGRPYGWRRPAPLSVVNQVLVAGNGELVSGNRMVGVNAQPRREQK
jgi:hypothetical protein